MRANNSKRLTVLSEAEKLVLYSLPDFDDFQRAEYFAALLQKIALARVKTLIFLIMRCKYRIVFQ